MKISFVKVNLGRGLSLEVQRCADGEYLVGTSDGVEASNVGITLVEFRRLLSAFPELYTGLPAEVATEENGLLPMRVKP